MSFFCERTGAERPVTSPSQQNFNEQIIYFITWQRYIKNMKKTRNLMIIFKKKEG